MVEWTPALEKVAEIAAAQFMGRGWSVPGYTRDDLIQEARIGVLKGVQNFDPAATNGYGSRDGFLYLCATRMMVTAMKAATREKHRAHNEADRLEARAATNADGDTLTLGDLVARYTDDPAYIVAAREDARRVLEAIARLTPKEREAFERCVLGGEPYEGHKPTDNAIQRARVKLRRLPIAA